MVEPTPTAGSRGFGYHPPFLVADPFMPLALSRILLLAALAALSALLAGCGSTQVRQRWSDPSDRAGPPKKTAIIVLADDAPLEHMAESQLARGLPRALGATAGHALGLEPGSDPAQAPTRKQLASQGFDAALVARWVSRDTSFQAVPPQPMFAAGPYYGGPFFPYYGYYPAYPNVYFTPGYLVATTHVVVETQLHRLPGGQPVWSTITDTEDPPSPAALVEELIRVLTRELEKAGLLPPS